MFHLYTTDLKGVNKQRLDTYVIITIFQKIHPLPSIHHPISDFFVSHFGRPGATNWTLVFASSDLHQLLAVKLPLGRVFVQEPAQKKS